MNGFSVYKSKLGFIKIDYEDDCLTGINVFSDKPANLGIQSEFSDKVFGELTEYFEGKRKSFDIKYKVTGTEFQKRVWNALTKIPYGQTRSYKDIAKSIGNEKACRAVGMANNKNPIMIIIPCHRVIGANGSLVGFGAGLDVKKTLLSIEGID